MKKIVIIGASGHGKVIADIALKAGYEKIVFLDDDKTITECAGFAVNGPICNIVNYADYDVIIAIGNAEIRQKIYTQIINYSVVTLIHPRAVISRRVSVGRGTVIMAGAVVNSDTKIGEGCIINTGASVDHDCIIGDFVHIAVGTHVAGTVKIGNRTWVGIGASVSNNLVIGEECMIGAGSVVVKNCMERGTYVGIPAKKIK